VEAAGGGEGLEVVGSEDGWGLRSRVGVRWGCEERGEGEVRVGLVVVEEFGDARVYGFDPVFGTSIGVQFE